MTLPAGLKKQYAGVPLYLWIVALVIVLFIVAWLRRRNAEEVNAEDLYYDGEQAYAPDAVPFTPDASPYAPIDPGDSGEVGLWDMQDVLDAYFDSQAAITDALSAGFEQQAEADNRVADILDDMDEDRENDDDGRNERPKDKPTGGSKPGAERKPKKPRNRGPKDPAHSRNRDGKRGKPKSKPRRRKSASGGVLRVRKSGESHMVRRRRRARR